MDNLAMDEKVVLGMDFLVEYGVFIDMVSNTVTIPRLNNHRPWSSVMEPHTMHLFALIRAKQRLSCYCHWTKRNYPI